VITSSRSFSQNTKNELKISREALVLIKKDLQICDSLKVSYYLQQKNILILANSNIGLFKKIEGANNRADFWQKQITAQEEEISKLQRRKKNRILWLGSGFLAGVILGAAL